MREFKKSQLRTWLKIIKRNPIDRPALRNVWLKDGYLVLTDGYIMVAYKTEVKYNSPRFITIERLEKLIKNNKTITALELDQASKDVFDKTFFGSFPEFKQLIPKDNKIFDTSICLDPKILTLLGGCFDEYLKLHCIFIKDKPLYFTGSEHNEDFALIMGVCI